MESYSDPERNYLRVVDAIQHIESRRPCTQSWYDTHYAHLCEYRKQFPVFADVNPDVESEQLRCLGAECDDLIDRMMTLYSYHKWFDPGDYLQLNKHILTILQLVDDVDSLDGLLSKLTLGRESH
jgi:hypothetical protein